MIKAKPKDRTAGPIDPAKLKGYVERIEAVEAEEADYKATKKDLYVEVKAAGLRPKMVRKLVKERKKTEADKEDEAELELYRAALAMPGATFRSVAKDLGVPRSTLHRLVPRNKNGTSAPKPEDGDDGTTVSTGGPVAVRNEGGSHDAGHLSNSRRHQTSEDDTADESLAAGVAAQADGDDDGVRPRGVLTPGPEVARAAPLALPADEAPAPQTVGAVAAEPRVATSTHIASQHVGCDYKMDGDEMPDQPPFLRGSRTGLGRA